jgi:ferredoxin
MRGYIKTELLDVDTALCTACGACVEACSSSVLKVRGFKLFNDRHVHVVKARDCNGCFACVPACPEGAIRER